MGTPLKCTKHFAGTPGSIPLSIQMHFYLPKGLFKKTVPASYHRIGGGRRFNERRTVILQNNIEQIERTIEPGERGMGVRISFYRVGDPKGVHGTSCHWIFEELLSRSKNDSR